MSEESDIDVNKFNGLTYKVQNKFTDLFNRWNIIKTHGELIPDLIKIYQKYILTKDRRSNSNVMEFFSPAQMTILLIRDKGLLVPDTIPELTNHIKIKHQFALFMMLNGFDIDDLLTQMN